MAININHYILKGTDGTHYILPNHLTSIHGVMHFMKKVIYDKELYFTTYTASSGKLVKTVSSLGRHLPRLFGYSQLFSREYKFSPLINFFFEQYRAHAISDYLLPYRGPDRQGTDLFNDFVATMRKSAIANRLKKQVADWESKPKKNMERLIKFEAAVFERYARPVAVRLDFYYHKATFTPAEIDRILLEATTQKINDQSDYVAGEDITQQRTVEGRIALEEVQEDRKRLFLNMKSKPSLFAHLVGYVWRIECGKAAGYHLHVLLFFDGSHVDKHEYLAQEIGHYWESTITKGRGYFHNCNREKTRYQDDWALGAIDYWDAPKREKLKAKILSYFCKTSQMIQVIPYAGCHLFGCGFVHRQRHVQGGRPRSKGMNVLNHQRPSP